MMPNMNNLRAFLDKQEANFGDPDIKTTLDFLWEAYSYLNPVSNELTKEKIEELAALSDSMSFENANRLYDTVAMLCYEIEHMAFIEGVRLGARLALELDIK